MIPRNNRMALVVKLIFVLALTACSNLSKSPLKSGTTKMEPSQPSAIRVVVNDGGPITLTTSTAEFQVRPDGYVQASLLKDGKKLSLDEPRAGVPADSDFVRIGDDQPGETFQHGCDFDRSRVPPG